MKNDLLTFTPAALQHIKSVLANHKDSVGFRLSVKQTGCSGYMYVPDVVKAANDSDEVMEIDGVTIFIDADAVPKIKGTEVDYVQKNLGVTQLVFNNPNAESECGCGESFNLKNEENGDE